MVVSKTPSSSSTLLQGWSFLLPCSSEDTLLYCQHRGSDCLITASVPDASTVGLFHHMDQGTLENVLVQEGNAKRGSGDRQWDEVSYPPF